MNDQSKNARNYNLAQLMVTAAAREIADGEVVDEGEDVVFADGLPRFFLPFRAKYSRSRSLIM